MKITKLISFALAGVLLLCAASGCGKKDTESDTSSTSSESDYDWDVPIGDNAEQTEDFDNTDEIDSPTPTPGQGSGSQSGGGSNTGGSSNNDSGNNSGSGGSDQTTEEPENLESDFDESVLADNDSLLFYFEGDNYAYGITDYNTEVIAFKDRSGKLVDAVSGAGKFELRSDSNRAVVSNYSIEEFSQTISDNQIKLFVTYRASGSAADDVSSTTEYTFYNNHIEVSASVDYSGDQVISASNSRFTKYFLNGYISSDKDFTTVWNYQDEDGDFPYKEIDSWCTVHYIDENNRMYTFLRSDNIPNYYWDYYNRYPENYLPLYATYNSDNNRFSDTVKFSLVFENCTEEENPDYRAYFAGTDLPVATGVEAVTESTDSSTVFVSDNVRLNLNVTNLTSEPVVFSYRYDIRDYYGNIVSAGLYTNSEVFPGFDANRIIDFNPGYYGIFFLNLMIVTENGAYYREYYPFALLEDYDYQYSATSPFGIGQILGGENEPYLDYLELAGKIGVATIRATPLSLDDIENSAAYIQKAQEENMRIFATGQGNRQYIDTFAQYGIDAFVSGNEQNLPTISGEADIDTAFDEYYNDYFLPGLENIKNQGYKYLIAAVAGGQTAWFERLNNIAGWDNFDAIALHPYGYPYSPDLPVSNIWHVEDSLRRNLEAQELYGYKETYVTETGYPTTAGDKRAVDLRTQADYNMRCYILSIAYGATNVLAYCFTDYSNSGVGVDENDNEYNFGCFYYPDFYGRIMPKPSAIMFANMTRQLESVQSAEINDKYDDGDLVRAFTLDTELDGDVIVAWSNCSRLPNDSLPSTRPDRKFVRPWENQWEGSHNVTFGTDSDTVEVIDTMGNVKTYKAENGTVTIALTGSPVIIKGAY